MSKNIKKEVKQNVDRAMSIVRRPTKPVAPVKIKKIPFKQELLPQTTACGGVAVGAQSIPPCNRNKKSKL